MTPTPPADLSAATWRKSTKSAGGSSNCVEIAHLPGLIAIRDSKNPHGGTLMVSQVIFEHITDRLKHGFLQHLSADDRLSFGNPR
jgi:Domain of unknown function (DUF397)